MELNITSFFRNSPGTHFYSASKVEMGDHAGSITWNNAVVSSLEHQILDTEDKRDAFRAHVKGFGAWSDEEIAAWSPQELNALLIQMISGDIREADLDQSDPDWEQYEEDSKEGRISGRLFKDIDDEIYYYIGE